MPDPSPTARPATAAEWLGPARSPARLGYVVVLLLATLVPFTPDADPGRVGERLGRMFHPGVSWGDVIDGARNIVLFAGWGAVWALTAARGSVRRILAAATGTGAVISVTVECLQLLSSNRNASVLDVATNTGGALAGAFGLILLIALAGERRRDRSFVGVPALVFGTGYGLSAFLEALIPLYRREMVAYGGPLTRFHEALAAFAPGSLLDVPWTDLPLFVPAGALAVAALAESGADYDAALRRVLLWGGGLTVLAELLHGLLGEPLIAGAVVLHAAAVALGAWSAARYLPRLSVALRGAARPRALAVTYGAVLAAWSWRPFLPEIRPGEILLKLTRDWYVPLAALSVNQDLFSVVDVCAPFFRFLPLGGLLAVWPWRRHGWLRGPLPAVWLAVILEVGQILVAGRMMDITDMIIPAAGALVGWAVLRRAGYPVYGEMGK
jgi:glycopeptide antibiotics resistance protein